MPLKTESPFFSFFFHLCGERNEQNEHVAHNRKLIQLLLRLKVCAGVPLIHCRVDKTKGTVHSNKKRWEKSFLFALTSKPFKLT